MIGSGLTINPYDQCTANKTINGRQCTIIIWHVDDLKISHVEKDVIEDIKESRSKSLGKKVLWRQQDTIPEGYAGSYTNNLTR